MSEFLKRERITTEADAAIWSVNAAVQRNRVYRSDSGREAFRAEWIRMIREQSGQYRSASKPISDDAHCKTMALIRDQLTAAFKPLLTDGRLTFGTSQKAFNLYLKYLWHLGKLPKSAPPPHCPVDRIILTKLGFDESWAKCDDQERYMEWINAIRLRSNSVHNWEDGVFLRAVSK
ncbi:MAG: hypothetical protein WBE37_07710 [Bryobacteraceae bacterium]